MQYASSHLASMLHYGYPLSAPGRPLTLPFDTPVLEAARDDRPLLRRLDEAALCHHGLRLWQQACRRIVTSQAGPFVLPLSSGLDSRAVLAGMLEQGATRIATVTYGVPGSFDYEIAPALARAAGVSHTCMSLHDMRVDLTRLDAIAHEPGWPSFFLDMYFNRLIGDLYGPDHTYLNGYLGDVLAGKYLHREGSPSWEDARQHFAVTNRYSSSTWLAPPSIAPEQLLPDEPFVDESLLGFDAQLEYAVRQECLMRPIVMRPDYRCVAPMLDPDWVAFMLALEPQHRHGRALFKRMFCTGYPDLFALPTAANGGLSLAASSRQVRRHKRRLKHRRRWRRRLRRIVPSVSVPLANPAWKYIDLRTALNERADLSLLLNRSMAYVQKQGMLPWLDPGQILREYRQGEIRHHRALMVLINVAVLSANADMDTAGAQPLDVR